jgi:hypothetical protein
MIRVSCDDSRHPAGKTADIQTFTRVASRTESTWIVPADFSPSSLEDYKRPDGSYRHKYSCNLCPVSVVCTESTLQRVLESLAEQGVSQVSLSTFNLIASRKH